jgi:hypothetical protein
MEIEADPTTLKAYINQYSGNSRFIRCLTLAEKQPAVRADALQLCLDMAKSEKKLK